MGSGSSPSQPEWFRRFREQPRRLARPRGPDEYLARLVYTTARRGTGAAVRIDAEVVWVADAPAPPVPSGAIATPTRYATVSLVRGSLGPDRVGLGPLSSAHLAHAVEALAPSPAPRSMEDAQFYRIIFQRAGAASCTVAGDGFGRTVPLAAAGRDRSLRRDTRCARIGLVSSLLPARAAGSLVQPPASTTTAGPGAASAFTARRFSLVERSRARTPAQSSRSQIQSQWSETTSPGASGASNSAPVRP